MSLRPLASLALVSALLLRGAMAADLAPLESYGNLPVLLVHGRKDTVVEPHQSEHMYRALKKAGKDVTLMHVDGEDHSLSSAETRLQTLEPVADYIQKKL